MVPKGRTDLGIWRFLMEAERYRYADPHQ